MVKKVKYITLAMLFLLIINNACSSRESFRLSDHYQIKIAGFKSDKQDAFCKNFKLSVEQVKFFFNKAEQITPSQMHNEYDWLPCYVYGEIIDNGKEYKWEIRLIGIGKVTTPSGDTIWYGCNSCDEIF